MENRLKERLTGAAILVALIVLLVPEMFRGEHPAGPHPGTAADGPPVRSYTIDLSNASGRAEPLQSTPASAGVPEGTAAAASAPSAPSSPTPTPTPTPTPASASAASAPAPAAASGRIGGRWSVQLGLFANRGNAERLARAAESRGFRVTVSSPDARKRYRVRVPGLKDRAAAEVVSHRLGAAGFSNAIVAP